MDGRACRVLQEACTMILIVTMIMMVILVMLTMQIVSSFACIVSVFRSLLESLDLMVVGMIITMIMMRELVSWGLQSRLLPGLVA